MVKDGNQKAGGKPPPESEGRVWLKAYKDWFVFGFKIFCVWLLEEFLNFKFGLEPWEIISNIMLFLGGGSLIISVLSIIFSYGIDTKKIDFQRPDHTPFWPHLKKIKSKLFKRYITHNALAGIFLTVAAYLIIPAGAVRLETGPKILHWFTTPTVVEERNAPSEEQEKESASDSSQPEENREGLSEADETVPENTKPENQETEQQQEPSLAYRLVLDEEEPEAVSSEERLELYFLAKPYQVTDWDSQAAVEAAVRKFIRDRWQLQRPPKFQENERSSSANQIISDASALEKEIKTAEDLRVVRDMRIGVYLGNPEDPEAEEELIYTLAKLIRENYCHYGDAYAFQKVSFSCACTNYEHSILWGFRTLEYDVTMKALYSNLMILVERYDKIVLVTDQESVEHIYASKLSEAFQTAADEVAAGADWLYS